ncbi:DUF2637 domain-containing protein [Streptomyces sp. TRM49041]|uniref:DUF2637 domain-containing protein n=1 Tax=Streptomyces sp. TRM49041 TaxID=2603216 RepID=UPI0011EF0E88|nr:DUF2637 domain-containing protein [Streptomyces sp. TRM49041]
MSRAGRFILVLGLVTVVLMAFRVSWNALSDVARAIGADPTAALLYPIVVDGLMALALVATLVLPGADRKFALRVLATYTVASLLLNYVHGLVPALHTDSIRWGRLTDLDYANWALVLLATSLPVGSIYFGSDLVAKVLHHNPGSADSPDAASDQSVGDQVPRSTPDRPESTSEPMPESAPAEVTEAPATGPTEGAEAAPATRPPRPTTVAESTGAAPRRATGRVPDAAKSTADRTRTPADLLDKARLLTADWSDDQLTAERLRRELRVGLPRARALRDQFRAERTGQAQPATDDGSKAGPLDGLNEAASTVGTG